MKGAWITCDRRRENREGIIVRENETLKYGREGVAKIDQVEDREKEGEGDQRKRRKRDIGKTNNGKININEGMGGHRVAERDKRGEGEKERWKTREERARWGEQ